LKVANIAKAFNPPRRGSTNCWFSFLTSSKSLIAILNCVALVLPSLVRNRLRKSSQHDEHLGNSGGASPRAWKSTSSGSSSRATPVRLYSHEVDSTRTPGIGKGKHFFSVATQFFWAILEKLTPARRVLQADWAGRPHSNVENVLAGQQRRGDVREVATAQVGCVKALRAPE